MKVLFVEPSFVEIHADDAIFPFGYACLGAVLQREGHQVEYLLPSVKRLDLQQVVEIVAATDARLIAIGGLTAYFNLITELVSRIKALRNDLLVVLGGPMVTYMPELALKRSSADFCVVGEGEKALLKLVDALERGTSLETITGLIYPSNGKVINNGFGEMMPFEEMPMPNWDDFPMDFYLYSGWYLPSWSRSNKTKVFAWMLSRGCPMKCNFCASGCEPRYKSIDLAVRELDQIVEKFDPDYLLFADNFLMREKNYISELCHAIIARGFRFKFSVTCRVNVVDDTLLALMRRAGCEMIFYGLECANDQILKFMRKGITVNQAVNAIELTKKAGIYPMVSIMFGQPAETLDDFYNSIKIALSTTIPADPVPNIASVMQLITFPGTGIFRHARETGLFSDDEDYWNKYGNDFIISYTGYNKQQVQKFVDKGNMLLRWKYHQSMADKLLLDFKEGTTRSSAFRNKVKLFFKNNPRILKACSLLLGKERIAMVERFSEHDDAQSKFISRCVSGIVKTHNRFRSGE